MFSHHWNILHILMQNEIIVESYWRKKKVTSYISTCTSKAAGDNTSKLKKGGAYSPLNECTKWLSFQNVCAYNLFLCQAFHTIPGETGAYISTSLLCRSITLHLLMLLVCFHFIVRQQQKLSSLFTQKTMEVEPEKHEDKLDKDDSEAWEVSSISQPPELQEPIGDSLDDVSCSKFQYQTCSLTETTFEMTQFKMPCGPLLLY